MAANWSEIPEELVSMVVERLLCVDDLIRFGTVCKPWRCVSILEKQKKEAYAPLLMLAKIDNDNLPSDDTDDRKGMMRSFVIPYDGDRDGGANPNKMRRSFDIELPKAQGRRCWGSPYGWVVTVGLDLNIHLLNPLTGEQLPLPPQPILQEQSLFSKKRPTKPPVDPDHIVVVSTRKFALGWHSSSQRWLVIAIFGPYREVAFTFTGIGNEASSSSSWTCIESTTGTEDIIFFQDRIFIIACNGVLSVCDINEGTPPKAIEVAASPEDLHVTDTERLYLMEIGGKLHFLIRYSDSINGEQGPISEHHYVTTDFVVSEFDFSESKWYELDDLGEYALFVGNNTSFAISTALYSDISSNCVYFTDDHYTKYDTRFCDMGVYDYEERTVEPFDIADTGAVSKFSRPNFFMPTL